MHKVASVSDNEEWDARSESTRESLPLASNPSLSLRKIPKQLVEVKEARCSQLKQSVHNYLVENAKLKAENTSLQSRIEFHREALLRSRANGPSKGMSLSVAAVTFLACVLTGDFGEETQGAGGRKMLQWGEESTLVLRLLVGAVLAMAAYFLVDAFLPKSSDRKNER